MLVDTCEEVPAGFIVTSITACTWQFVHHCVWSPLGKESFKLNISLVLKVVKTSLISIGLQNQLMSWCILVYAVDKKWPSGSGQCKGFWSRTSTDVHVPSKDVW